ncbi:transcriptional regulator [Lactobacillus intestinalis]|uniref:Rgg family transcriptional regulator n=1 Tax=Lactobacillus intestinalis TaxID=151781 RepID=UPI002637C278|nr:transcriptional regulator [Lactobacillus intestinalis]
MKINEALKKERLAQHKTQARWIKDINMSVSHYSEIESGYVRNGVSSDIDSEDLILLLKSNHDNINDFFDLVQDSYIVSESTTVAQQLFEELYIAFTNKDYKKADKIKKEIVQMPNIPKSLRYCASLITADLKDNMLSLDQKVKDEIDRYIYQSNDWVNNNEALIIFGNSIPVLNKENLVMRMGQLLRRYKDINEFPKNIKIRISTICMNYLYDAILNRKIDKHIEECFKLINELPADDVFGLKKIIARYLSDVYNGKETYSEELRSIFIRSGMKNIADHLFI